MERRSISLVTVNRNGNNEIPCLITDSQITERTIPNVADVVVRVKIVTYLTVLGVKALKTCISFDPAFMRIKAYECDFPCLTTGNYHGFTWQASPEAALPTPDLVWSCASQS